MKSDLRPIVDVPDTYDQCAENYTQHMNTRRDFLFVLTTALGTRALGAPEKPKTILLQSAWDTVNIGDIGHTPGTLRVIEEHLPEVQVILWAMKLDDRVTAMLK